MTRLERLIESRVKWMVNFMAASVAVWMMAGLLGLGLFLGHGGGSVAFAVSVTRPIPDTGQTIIFSDTFGEDSDYTINPPSYTKLDAQGKPLPDSATSWSMIKDNVTGLIWENKTDDGLIHDKDNTYSWIDAHTIFIARLNNEKFGGFSDWRLPTIKELSMIVDRGACSNPAINQKYFPNTMSSLYWSSTTYAGLTDSAWCVNFGYGSVHNDSKSSSYYVRGVRGGQD